MSLGTLASGGNELDSDSNFDIHWRQNKNLILKPHKKGNGEGYPTTSAHEKMAGTNWESSSSILREVYTGNVHHDGIQSSSILREVYTGNVHHDGIQSSSILREVYTGNVHHDGIQGSSLSVHRQCPPWWNTEQQHPQCTQAMSTMMEYRAAASSVYTGNVHHDGIQSSSILREVYTGNVHHDGIQSSSILREVDTGNVHHEGIQSSSILREVYTGNVHPVVEYRAAVRATTTKSNTSRQVKVQNKGMHMIIGGLKPIPTLTMETATRLPSLDLCQEDKMTRRKSPHPHWENQKTEWSPSQTSSTAHKEHYEENQLQPPCQTSHKIPCWDLASQPSRETWCRWLEMPDARCALLYRSARSYNKKTVNMIQPARLAHRKCWIGTTTHQCGLMSTQIDPLMQLSETAGEGSISTLATGKCFQHCWLLVYCQTTRAELTAL